MRTVGKNAAASVYLFCCICCLFCYYLSFIFTIQEEVMLSFIPIIMTMEESLSQYMRLQMVFILLK